MKKRLKLTVIYDDGDKIEQLVNYLHFEDGAIYFTADVA